MPIIELVLVLALVGLAVWLIVTYIPMPAPIKNLIVIVVVVLLVIWILQLTGLANLGPTVPRIR